MRAFLCAMLLQMLSFAAYASAEGALAENKYESNANIEILVGSVSDNSLQGVIVFDIQPGWHIYAQDPGDVGMPTRFEFDEKEVKNSQVHWPKYFKKTDKIGGTTFTSNIYTNTVGFPITLQTTRNDVSQVSVHISFAVCGELCIPQSRVIPIELPTTSNFEDDKVLTLIQQWLEK